MNKKRIVSIACSALLAGSMLSTVGCGGGSSSDDVQFWVKGSQQELATYTRMVDEFNATYGAEHGIRVQLTSKTLSGYNNAILSSASTKAGPDVFLEIEDNFKKNVISGLMGEITNELNAVTDIEWDTIYDSTLNRLRFNTATNTSGPNDPIYGLPVDTKPTGLYYNETLFEKMGVVIISVDEDKLDAWNRNEIKDNKGMKKSDYEAKYPRMKNRTIPAKGYYRSEYPYTGKGQWRLPDMTNPADADGELLVFNNRIAMNWDEVEDLGRLFTPAYNPAAKTVQFGMDRGGNPLTGVNYGYFTEWWFNYGWSVGGDCLADLTGNGDWNFSLLDPNTNYIVLEGQTYTGAYTGKVYQAGETLSLNDKLNVPAGETLVPIEADGDKDAGWIGGGYSYNGQVVGSRPDCETAADNGVLGRLPSTREAFTRYLKLGAEDGLDSDGNPSATVTPADIDGESGLDISPNPNTFTTGNTYTSYFIQGEVAMVVNYSIYMSEIAEALDAYGLKWDVAPLVIYKEYEDPTDPQNDTVKIQGKAAGHNNSTALVVRRRSTKKDKAAAFIAWAASEAGQRIRAHDGFFPNQGSLLNEVRFPEGVAPQNVQVFADAIEFQGAGDWWYMPDYVWINEWAVPLNSKVRNGTKNYGYSVWYNEVITLTNTTLKNYKDYQVEK